MLKQSLKIGKLPVFKLNTRCPHLPALSVTFNSSSLVKFYTSDSNLIKLHAFNENLFAFNILTKEISIKRANVPEITQEVKTLEEFNILLKQNWRQASASDIVSTFKNIQSYCIDNNISLEDTRFDNLVDGLMDQCEKLTYLEIVDLLECLYRLPPCSSYEAHNFHDVWSCLDDICCWQMIEWNVEQSFTVANLWFQLKLGRICDYIFVLIDRLTKRADKLNKHQLVHIMFYFNICRKRVVDFEYEYAISKCINEMNVDEMAIISMGYFKTRTKVKLLPILQAMVKSVIASSHTVHDISLTAILKILRLSSPKKIITEVHFMLDKIIEEIPRLSNLCCIHLILIGTSSQTFHKETLQKVCEKLVCDIPNKEKMRLKDIERLLNVLAMFDYDPKTRPDIFKACYEELHKSNRNDELVKYNRCLGCALHFLSLRNIYSYELMNKVLDEEYVTEIYGKTAKYLPLEIFSLDRSIDIECPDYTGVRLPSSLKYKAAKWLSEYTPSYDQYKKITAIDQFILDTIDTVKEVVGNERFLYIDHVLPHFYRADIILCKNKHTGQFIAPYGFSNYCLGDIMFPPKDDKLQWFSLVTLGWHNTVKDSNIPLGHMLMKKRQLAKIGYEPVFVISKEFLDLSKEGRKEYIRNKIT